MKAKWESRFDKLAKLIWEGTRSYRDRELDFVLRWKGVRTEEKQDYIKIAKKVIKANDKKWKARIEGIDIKLNKGTLERITTELSMLQEGSIFRSDVAYLVKMFNLLNSALDKLFLNQQ